MMPQTITYVSFNDIQIMVLVVFLSLNDSVSYMIYDIFMKSPLNKKKERFVVYLAL